MRTIEIDLPRSFNVLTNVEPAIFEITVSTTIKDQTISITRWLSRAFHNGNRVWCAWRDTPAASGQTKVSVVQSLPSFIGFHHMRNEAEEIAVSHGANELRSLVVQTLATST